MWSLHREQEAASAYRCEVEELDLPPGLLQSSQPQGHSGVRVEAARAMMLCWSQPPSPLSLAGQWNEFVWAAEVNLSWMDGVRGVADSEGPAGTMFRPGQGVLLLLTLWHFCLAVSFL